MQIYLMRHGGAEAAQAGEADSARGLTPEGEAEVRTVARAAAAKLADVVMISSPYRRAMQTSRIVAKEIGSSGELLRSTALTPDSKPRVAWDELRAHRGDFGLFVVTHEPLVSALAAYLLGTPELTIYFVTATLACIELTSDGAQPSGTLKWMITPDVIPRNGS